MPQTVFDITLPTNTLQSLTRVRHCAVRQDIYSHDVLTFDAYGYSGRELNLRSGDPIKAVLRHASDSLTFVGYVHAMKPVDQNSTQQRRVVVTAFGPSYKMKTSRQRVWTSIRATDVVRQVANTYRLTPDVEDHPFIFDVLTQPGISDWALLVRLAKRLGYVFFVSGTTLIFRSRNRDLRRRRDAAPILRYLDRGNSSTTRSDISLFTPTLSENNPYPEGMKGRRTLFGVDERQSTVLRDTRDGSSPYASRPENGAGQFEVFDTESIATSAGEVLVRNQGKDELARYQHRATATTEGRPRLRQADEVYLSNLPADYAGYWTTQTVLHKFGDEKYQMHLELGTDSLGVPTQQTSPTVSLARAVDDAVFDRNTGLWVSTRSTAPSPLASPGA